MVLPEQQYFTLAELVERWGKSQQFIFELFVSLRIEAAAVVEDAQARPLLEKREAPDGSDEVPELYLGEPTPLNGIVGLHIENFPIDGKVSIYSLYYLDDLKSGFISPWGVHIELTAILVPARSVEFIDYLLSEKAQESPAREIEHLTPEIQLMLEAQKLFWSHERVDRHDDSTWPKQGAVAAWFEKRLGPKSAVRSKQLASSISPLWARKPGRR